MAQMIINPEELKSSASTMLSKSDEMKNNLNKVSGLMNELKGYWDSPAATKLKAEFEELKAKFPAYYQKVEDYSTFLTIRAQQTDADETSIQSAFK